jgi:tRNA A-37 threonylcarbamoyl transferase component Bud32
MSPNLPYQDGRQHERELIRAAQHEAFERGDDSSTVSGAQPSEPSLAEPAPDSFTGYLITREIHRGGQGVVYQALQQSTQRKVAIKVLKEGPFASPIDRARFEREAQVLAQIRHPNIVAIHDRGQAGGHYFLVMDYISGQPLDVYMASTAPSVARTLGLFAKICDAVSAAHVRGVIHRDLKPRNVIVDADGEPHVLDFGLAKVAIHEEGKHAGPELMTATGQFVGSLPWASPEQVEGHPEQIDLRSDVYALGVILYQMLTARFPYPVVGQFRTVMDHILRTNPIRPRTLRRDIDDEVQTIVLKCLSKERERRYQTAGELARDVRRYLAGEPIEAKRDSTAYLLRKVAQRRKWELTGVAVAGLAIAVGYTFWSRAARRTQWEHRQRVAALIQSQRSADEEEVRALYQDFFARLKEGRTSPEERELFLANTFDLELQTREIWSTDRRWRAGILVKPKVELGEHGLELAVTTTYSLGDTVLPQKYPDCRFWISSLGPGMTSGIVADGDLGGLPNLAPPARLELTARSQLIICWTHDLPAGHASPERDRSEWSPVDPVWTSERTTRRSVLVLKTLPDDYPVPVADPELLGQVQAGLTNVRLLVSEFGTGGIECHYTGAIPLAGRLQALGTESDDILGEMDICLQTFGKGLQRTFGPADWNTDFLTAVWSGGLTTVRIRFVPDREVALSKFDVTAYVGLPVESSASVAALSAGPPQAGD